MRDICVQAQELFPWVLNQTAGDDEQQLVHRHVMACDDCRREFALATIAARRIEAEIGRLPGLTPGDMATLRTAIPAEPDDEPLLSKLATMLDALGMPAIIGDAVRGGAAFTSDSQTVRLDLPLLAPVNVRL